VSVSLGLSSVPTVAGTGARALEGLALERRADELAGRDVPSVGVGLERVGDGVGLAEAERRLLRVEGGELGPRRVRDHQAGVALLLVEDVRDLGEGRGHGFAPHARVHAQLVLERQRVAELGGVVVLALQRIELLEEVGAPGLAGEALVEHDIEVEAAHRDRRLRVEQERRLDDLGRLQRALRPAEEQHADVVEALGQGLGRRERLLGAEGGDGVGRTSRLLRVAHHDDGHGLVGPHVHLLLGGVSAAFSSRH